MKDDGLNSNVAVSRPWADARWYQPVSLLLVLFLLALLLMFPSNPLASLPGRDNGVFLYGGQQVLEGRLPYVDFWDHKGPLIYYINAFGLWLAGGSRWGVWIVELCFLIATAFVIFKLLEELGNWFFATLGVMVWFYGMSRVGSYVHFQDSNYTETYALLFAACLLYFWVSPSEFLRKEPVRYFLVGFMGGCSFFLRPNNISMLIAVVLIEILVRKKTGQKTWVLKRISMLTLGFAGAILPWLVFFLFRGGLPALLDSVFVYNFMYSQDRNASFIDFFLHGVALMGGLPLIGYLLLLTGFGLQKRTHSLLVMHEKLADLLLIGWPIEVVLSSLSKRILLHYYITWTPYLALTGVFGLLMLLPSMPHKKGAHLWGAAVVSILALGLFFYSIDIPSYSSTAKNTMDNRRNGIHLQSAIAQRIDAISRPEDTILVWGNEVWINFLSDRRSPTRYVYQYPLFLQGYTDTSKVESFLNDLQQKTPALIIEPVVDTDEIFPLSMDRRNALAEKRKIPPGMEAVFEYIDLNYCVVAIYNDIVVYQFLGRVDDTFPCISP